MFLTLTHCGDFGKSIHLLARVRVRGGVDPGLVTSPFQGNMQDQLTSQFCFWTVGENLLTARHKLYQPTSGNVQVHSGFAHNQTMMHPTAVFCCTLRNWSTAQNDTDKHCDTQAVIICCCIDSLLFCIMTGGLPKFFNRTKKLKI